MSIKKFFALLFVISLCVFLFFKFYPMIQDDTKAPVSKSSKTTMHQKPHLPSISVENNFSTDDDFILIASLISSVLSFLGFILSSYYSMRGHQRDEEIFSLKRERERLEMAKIQAEIQALTRR